jgi:hypothetical protein
MIKKDEMGGACSMDINMCKILVGEPEGKRPFRRPMHR